MDENYPAADGYFMPAEWERHRRCWMAWPCRHERWVERYDLACIAYAAVARAIAAHEPVNMLTRPEMLPAATLQLGRKVEVMAADLDDSLLRDSGPSFIMHESGGIGGVAWRFNGWGNRWHGYAHDATLAERLLGQQNLPAYEGPMVLEGSAVETDGSGTVMATEASILDDNRNPTLDRRQVEERLALHLGIRKIIWLPGGLCGDASDDCVGDVARFVAPATVLCAVAQSGHPAYHALQENADTLRAEKDAFGRSLQVIEVPLPTATGGSDDIGRRGQSYLSFYIGNSAVFLPTFLSPSDDAACRQIAEAIPGVHEMVTLPAQDLVAGGVGLRDIVLPEPLPAHQDIGAVS